MGKGVETLQKSVTFKVSNRSGTEKDKLHKTIALEKSGTKRCKLCDTNHCQWQEQGPQVVPRGFSPIKYRVGNASWS